MIESTMYLHIAKWAAAHKVFFQRIESSGTGLGIPDIYICFDGKGMWIECKQIVGASSRIHFEKGQRAWHKKLKAAGGAAFVVFYLNFERLWGITKEEDIDPLGIMNKCLMVSDPSSHLFYYLDSYGSQK